MRNEEISMAFFDAMPRDFRDKANENDELIPDFWINNLSQVELEAAMRINRPAAMQAFLEARLEERIERCGKLSRPSSAY